MKYWNHLFHFLLVKDLAHNSILLQHSTCNLYVNCQNRKAIGAYALLTARFSQILAKILGQMLLILTDFAGLTDFFKDTRIISLI